MKRYLLVVAFLLAACSKVTEDNYRKIEDGMTEEQVVAILGKPTESSSVSVLGIGGTVSRWVSGDAVITVRFINGKASLKGYDKPGTK